MKQKYYTTAQDSYAPYNGANSNIVFGGSYNTSYEKEFDKYDDAVEAAKKTASRTKEDVVIYKIASVVKFPTDNLKVVDVD